MAVSSASGYLAGGEYAGRLVCLVRLLQSLLLLPQRGASYLFPMLAREFLTVEQEGCLHECHLPIRAQLLHRNSSLPHPTSDWETHHLFYYEYYLLARGKPYHS